MNNNSKYTPDNVPLLVLGFIFLQNLLEERKVKLEHEGAHCRSAESIRAACEPYYKKQFWHRIFGWLGWIISIASGLVVITVVPVDFWCLVPAVVGVVVCAILYYWFDPEKIMRANPQMKEFIRIRQLWEPQRAFYLKSGYVGHLTPLFYRLSEHTITQLGFDCVVWMINGETHKLRGKLTDIMTSAMLEMAHEYHIIEYTADDDAEVITKARQQLDLLLKNLSAGTYHFVFGWTVGKAVKAAIDKFGKYDPAKRQVVSPTAASTENPVVS